MDYPGLVPEVTLHAYRFSSSSSFQNRPVSHPDRTTSPSVENNEAHDVCLTLEMLEKQGIPRDTAKIILSACRDCAKRCYDSGIKRWVQHCLNQVKNPLGPSANELIIFLSRLQRGQRLQHFECCMQCCLYTVFKWRLFSGQPCSCPKMFKGRV